MEYLITDFRDVHVESYPLTHSIDRQLEEIRLFKAFLEEHRALIIDKKTFVGEGEDPEAGRKLGGLEKLGEISMIVISAMLLQIPCDNTIAPVSKFKSSIHELRRQDKNLNDAGRDCQTICRRQRQRSGQVSLGLFITSQLAECAFKKIQK